MIEPNDGRSEAQFMLDDECAEFQALMSVRIGAGEDLQSYDHMLTCERCRALVHDLEQIAIAARELMGMEQEPTDDLWDKLSRKLSDTGSKDIDSDNPDGFELPAIN